MSKKKSYKVTFHDQHGRESLCLVGLSDAWRRGAKFNRPKLADAFNKEARKLCAAVQWLDLDAAAAWPGQNTRTALDNIEKLAEDYNIDRVILPVYEGSPAGDWLQTVMNQRASSDIVLEQQSVPYGTTKLDRIGKVDTRRKTALDFGLAYVVK